MFKARSCALFLVYMEIFELQYLMPELAYMMAIWTGPKILKKNKSF